MIFKKHSPTQDSIFKIYQGAFSNIEPAPAGQLKTADVVLPKSKIDTVVISSPQGEKDSQASEQTEDDGM